jgi:hypothetical protein
MDDIDIAAYEARLAQSIKDYAFIIPRLQGTKFVRGNLVQGNIQEDMGRCADLVDEADHIFSLRGLPFTDIKYYGMWTVRLCRSECKATPYCIGPEKTVKDCRRQVAKANRCDGSMSGHRGNEWTKLRLHADWHLHYWRNRADNDFAALAIIDVKKFFEYVDTCDRLSDWCYEDMGVKPGKDGWTPFVNARMFEDDGKTKKPYVLTCWLDK